ncbi:MAG: hypothetical protein IJ806_09945 [Ruminococcus sp.]|nr:hypothetical protein [Ruminococcus sp.]
MPSSPVHLELALIMAEELGVRNKGDFLLGSISPDCVNYGMEQASEEVRYAAHIRDRDYDRWKAMLREFYKKELPESEGSEDFLRGYLFHCWCDIAWDEAVQPELFEFLGTLGYGYDDMTGQKWRELYRFNGVVMGAPEYQECRRLCAKGRPRAIAGCSEELILKFRDYVINDYRDKVLDEKPLFLSGGHILKTVRQMRAMGYDKELSL